MANLLKTIARKFLGSESGNIAMSFAVAFVPLMGAVGAAVDYSRLSRAHSELQNAVDAAVLAAAKQFSQSTDTKSLESYAENYFTSNFDIGYPNLTATFQLSTRNTNKFNSTQEAVGLELVGTANLTYPMTFSKVVGQTDKPLSATASVEVHSNTAEVAFVFDASGSMTDNDGFQKSTKAAHDLLHDMKQFVLRMQQATGTDTEYFRYSLVPFAHSVNIGPEYETDDAVVDTLGLSFHHHDHIDWAQGVSGAIKTGDGWKSGSDWLTKFTLVDGIKDDWMGCVEARPGPYFLDDTAPNIMNADTLFVPMLAPDEPDNLASGEIDYPNNYLEDHVQSTGPDITINNSNSGNSTKQERRLAWTSKYNTKATVHKYDQSGLGPNRPCFDYPIYPLNGEFGQTNAQISHLNNTYSSAHSIGSGDDDGASNIQQGIVWGWRTVSSVAPFTEGRSESDPLNRKVLIVITDGINSYGENSTPVESEYGAFGYVNDGRLDYGISSPNTKTVRQKMDEQTLKTCALAKAAGIQIFVIGYGVTSGSQEEGLLSQCSGGPEFSQAYFNVSDETSLTNAFNRIKEYLSNMALTS